MYHHRNLLDVQGPQDRSLHNYHLTDGARVGFAVELPQIIISGQKPSMVLELTKSNKHFARGRGQGGGARELLSRVNIFQGSKYRPVCILV